MKYLLFAFLCFTLLSCSNNETQAERITASSKMLILNKDQFSKKIANTPNAQLIDVRTPEEVAAGKIENAVNIDFYADDFENKIMALNKEKPVLLYCKSGGRSGKTAKKLQNAGFKEIYDLDGGYTDWSK